jgi:methionine-S-sulfoxide reductase
MSALKRATGPVAGVVVGGVALAAVLWVVSARGSGTESRNPAADSGQREVAILAGGCFWGMEDLLRELDGVVETEVGYAGGSSPNVGYDAVRTGRTGHAEAVRVVYDPARLSYEELLRFYFRIHDPTTKNRQGNDIGSQYRSVILVLDDGQRRVAEAVRADVDASGFWSDPIVTEIAEAGPFVDAEAYHQDYLEKNPGGYTCHWIRPER